MQPPDTGGGLERTDAEGIESSWGGDKEAEGAQKSMTDNQ